VTCRNSENVVRINEEAAAINDIRRLLRWISEKTVTCPLVSPVLSQSLRARWLLIFVEASCGGAI